MPAAEGLWRKTAWNGVVFTLPASWQPAVIRNAYLFFEHQGQPAFAIKWERVRGRFSAERVLKRLQDTSRQAGATLGRWNAQAGLPDLLRDHAATGFQYRTEHGGVLGVLLYCPLCRRAVLLQLYISDQRNEETMSRILHSLADHPTREEQTWSIYDISAQLPVAAELKSQEFLAGRYTLSFTLNKTGIDLYRFKPAAAILRNRNLREFGSSLAGDAVCVQEVDNRIAVWQQTASGLNRLAVLAGRKPGWIWLRIELVEEHNAILAVKGSGRGTMDRKLLEHIAEQFIVTEAV